MLRGNAPAAPDHDPCFDCPCCASWLQSLEVLQFAIARHEIELHVTTGLEPGCLVCERPTWKGPRTGGLG